ncbi:MAG: YihY/virulence factor BrkB family protein [Deltaproteobacteria bacterium]|nr:YihY/virulence factor BrkB family protein [Deltaproteobacteria bacterium]
MGANQNHQTPRAPYLYELIMSRLSAERAKEDLERLEKLSRHGPLGILRTATAGFNRHNCSLWASALTFTFSLSLIPMLAVALSAVQVLIGIDKITPIIKQYLAINSRQLTDQIMQYVGHINATTLGAVGGATLLITVIMTLSTVEQALNTIFNVAQGRSWLRKFTDYLSITFTLPLLIAIALTLQQNFEFNLLRLPVLGWLIALIPVWVGFSFLYLFFPNRHVKWSCAMLGGFVAAVLLEIGQWAYLRFQVRAGEYQAIYGALAAVQSS